MSATNLKLTSAGLRYIAADFACNADHPVHRENLKTVVCSALEKAADRVDELEKLLAEWEETARLDPAMYMPERDDLRVKTRAALGVKS